MMAENQRTGFVWRTFMTNPEMQAAMNAAGFHLGASQAGRGGVPRRETNLRGWQQASAKRIRSLLASGIAAAHARA
ncbi:MAG TPA: hypothetical protein VFI95_08455, partial [Terriglobales bacterium]|nr:hypothetical protein [Terriglobales bacterium]